MNGETVRAFIQARMSSTRFPGKVLAPFKGRPIIAHVIERVAEATPVDRIVVATSVEESDDPLAKYVESLGVSAFRGSLDDVVGRFCACHEQFPCTWFFRVSADSPLLESSLLGAALEHSHRSDVDLVTNVFPRTFPPGQSVEMVKASRFLEVARRPLTAAQREHVTLVYYDNPGEFSIVNLESTRADRAGHSYSVDTVDDLGRLASASAYRISPQEIRSTG